MIEHFSCPACELRDWKAVARYSYRRDERTVPGQRPLTDWELLRRRILFEVWAPEREQLTLTAQTCRRCGLMTYTPRPSAADVARKYEFLQRHEPEIGGSESDSRGRRRDRRRAKLTHRALVHGLGRDPARVLDFGGGDGKLLSPFMDGGADCFLVDHNRRPLPGVKRLGATLEGLPELERFDGVICSHVLEHLADPASALRQLRERLSPDGAIFVEVPLEIWREIPIRRDPVTHINFFGLLSLVQLHERCGLETRVARTAIGSYGPARKPVAVVVSRQGSRSSSLAVGGAAETERLLDPPLSAQLMRAVRLRRLPGRLGRLGRRRRP